MQLYLLEEVFIKVIVVSATFLEEDNVLLWVMCKSWWYFDMDSGDYGRVLASRFSQHFTFDKND